MESKDTVSLLQKCDLGTKMAVSSIDDVLDKLQNTKLRELLQKSKEHHEKLGNERHELLLRHHAEIQDPGLMAKGMSWIKTNAKLALDESDKTVADLMTDGCNMGIKTLNRFLNQYEAADEKSKDIAKRLIRLEEKLVEEIRQFL